MNLAIGDEQTPGYNPKGLNNRAVSKALTKALDEKTVCKGIKGASLTLKGKGNIMHQLDQFSLPAYDRIFLFYGMNDYLYSKDKLGPIGQHVAEAIKKIRQKSQWIKIYGILPLPTYNKYGKPYANLRGPAFYTLRDLMEMLGLAYANSDTHSLNWMTLPTPIINKINYRKRLKDGRYPTKETSQRMATWISRFVRSMEK